MRSLLSLLRCPVCNQPLDNPTTLPCGHTLCASHLTSHSCPLTFCVRPVRPPSPILICFQDNQTPPETDHHVDVTVNKLIEILSRHYAPPDPGSRSPPRKRRRRHYSQSETEQDLLQHLRNESRKQRNTPRDTALLDRDLQTECDSDECDDDDATDTDRISRSKTRSTSPSPPRALSPRARLEKELLTELTCEICFQLLYQPITTPCQHVRKCISMTFLIS
jgi:hypothetical protein